MLSCKVEGSMRHNLTWYRAGRAIQAPTGGFKVLPDSSLQISGVRAQDAGEYHCVATNAHGDSRIVVWLHVPGTVARCTAGHLFKCLTHWGLSSSQTPVICFPLLTLPCSQVEQLPHQKNVCHRPECMPIKKASSTVDRCFFLFFKSTRM